MFLFVAGMLLFPHCQTTSSQQTKIIKTDWNAFYSSPEEEKISRYQLAAPYYLVSNEHRLELFKPYIENKKGGYVGVGVGTDQNFILIGWAKPEYAYLMDFEPISVCTNKIHIEFIRRSQSYDEFLDFYKKKNYERGLSIIKETLGQDRYYDQCLIAYKALNQQKAFLWRHDNVTKAARDFKWKAWFNNDEDYKVVRDIVLANKVRAVLGDLTKDITFQGIGEASRKLHIPINVLYFSNAEDYFRYPEAWKKSFQTFFISEDSTILRTISVKMRNFKWASGGLNESTDWATGFHYNIQKVSNHLLHLDHGDVMNKKFRHTKMMQDARILKQGLSEIIKVPLAFQSE